MWIDLIQVRLDNPVLKKNLRIPELNLFQETKKNLYVENASNIQIRNEAFKFQSNKYKKYYHLLKGYEKKYSWIQI